MLYKKECDKILLLIIKNLYDEINTNFLDRNEVIKLIIEMSKIIKEYKEVK